ncbi:S8 family serine peptidase [Polluticoccus soli]|uniref:S8 family serine peptidase n=1 Tax=Polluticoccus soli TaxID=3034150 RepID=UPI0023E21B18|nr:S8 family serine peptidase [Flavipsychrobacter sp. JY13-12]
MKFRTANIGTQSKASPLSGLRVVSRIGDRLYTAIIDQEATMRLSEQIEFISEVKPEWKLSELLLPVSGNDKVEIIASFVSGVGHEEIESSILSLGGELIPTDLQSSGIYKANVPGSKLKQLAAWYGVEYLSRGSEDVPLNFESKTATKANLGSLAIGSGGFGLTGAGVTIGVGDNISGIGHIDLRDRVINYAPGPYANHGVHINGIVGGAGIVDPKGEGFAPRATLVDHLFSQVWEQTTAMYQAHNMTITNNSYAAVIGSCNYAGTYDVNSLAVDKTALQHQDVLHVFAAGNDGYLNCSPFPQGFATVNGGYQPAKNNIVVTSTDKRYVNASDGGRGPVKDGRLKPEITAVGVDVRSTTRSEEYLTSGGTSMACPNVSGALGLLTERYRQLFGNVNPPAVVLKAILLNGATDIGNPGPDYRFGFGFMNIGRSLQIMNSNRFNSNNVANGGQQTFNITVPPNTAQLKVMLCWHDAPGNPAMLKQLVNDLDLEVAEPNATVHRPLILDPSAPNILNNAVEGLDRLNNVEQVVVSNPAPGNYIVTAKGFNIPMGSQDYVIAYDFVPSGVAITYPTTDAKVKANDSLRIYWDASDDNNTFALEISDNAGGSWTTISNNIPASQRYYTWLIPSINSGKCQMRLTRNNTGQSSTTGDFIINSQPVAELDAVQCPGYIRLKWNSIANATGYRMYRKIGPAMVDVATTSSTTYDFTGLSLDSIYYVAVAPIVDGLVGHRSIAVKRQPNTGDCAGNISDGDLMLERIVGPNTGRKFTSTELKTSEPISVLVRNLDDVTTNNFKLSYSVNGGVWQSQNFTTPISANSNLKIDLANIDLSALGAYDVQVAIQNLLASDPVSANDTIVKTVKQLSNDPVSLASTFVDDFENLPALLATTDLIGVSDRWDYLNNTDTGRFRSFVNPSITLNGQRSISLDAYKSTPDNQNDFIGTFNLANYNASVEEVRVEFDYLVHGRPKFREGNEVWIRGNDTQLWQSLYTFNPDSTGKVLNTGSLSITDGLQGGGQNFSTSFQLRVGQHDSSVIAARNYGNGTTFDDVKLYTVQNDMQLLSIVAPGNSECGITGAEPLVIRLRNGVNQALTNVEVNYRLDENAVVTEILPSVAGKTTRDYSFTELLDLSQPGAHNLRVWVNAQGDSYHKNDSINSYTIQNQPLITQYPYFENFESGAGGWFSNGQNNSWEFGVPQSPKVNKAASGTKAWKTNLDGNYNDLEFSFLNSPCFDLKGMSNPTLRFKAAMDIENCGGILCDAGYVEYSTDGATWTRLEDQKKGINWYNDTAYKVWTIEDFTAWHEVSSPLPKENNTIRLRFVMMSDQSSTREGIAIDDVEVFDRMLVPANTLVSIGPNPTYDGKFNIVWAAASGTEMQITMTDILGREVFRGTVTAQESFNQSTIQTTHFNSGVYLMRIEFANKTFSYKIVYL